MNKDKIDLLNRQIWLKNITRNRKQAMLLEDDLIEEMK